MKWILYGIAYPSGHLVTTCSLSQTRQHAEMIAWDRSRDPEHKKHGPFQVVKLKYKTQEH